MRTTSALFRSAGRTGRPAFSILLSLVAVLCALPRVASGQAAAATGGGAADAADPAERPALQLDDLDRWRTIRGETWSRDGTWLAYELAPRRGDGELVVRQVDGDTEYRRPRGGRPRFTADGRQVIYRVAAAFAAQREHAIDELLQKQAKREAREQGEKPPELPDLEQPEGSHAILDLEDGSVEELADLESFRVTDEGPAFVLLHFEPPEEVEEETADDGTEAAAAAAGEEPAAGEPAVGETADDDEDEPPAWREDGAPLVLRDLRDGSELCLAGVVDYGLWDEAGWCWYARNSAQDDPEIARGLFARNLETGAEITLIDGAGEFRGFTTDDEQTNVAFYSNRDDREADEPRFDVFVWEVGAPQARRVLSRGHVGVPDDEHVAAEHRLQFSRDGGVLMVATELPEPEDLPPILDDEKVVVDVWNWRDGRLQSMQERRRRQLTTERARYALHLDDGLPAERRLVRLDRHPRESVRLLTPDGSLALVGDGESYAPEMSWDGRYRDFHVVDTLDGTRRQVLAHHRGRMSPSPDGRYLLHFDGVHWHCTDLSATPPIAHCLTADIDADFARATDDRPEPRNADGVAGWVEGEGEVLLLDGQDIWAVTPDGARARCITDGIGAAKNIEFRYVALDDELRHVPSGEPILLRGTDLDTMDAGFWRDRVDGLGRPEALIVRACAFGNPEPAKDAPERLFFTMMRFEQFPDLWTAGPDFAAPRQLTAANPQQRDYRWGRAELVTWRSLDGEPLKGILIKPDGFDPQRQYPLMVYFYEKRSRSLHSYGRPRLNTSPQAIQYVSDGYLWFVPDIHYRDGHPGESALKCIVPGVQSLVARGFVDPAAIGAAGHSWGGYQTAFLATRTDIFAALESGAPVSNMTSAYGGIRWGSGMSRAFQYERTQSRIGATLWQQRRLYLENSPLFAADKVRTPILMIHNDEDGAVPWYQGIEYFCALRRLGKEAYLLNYNGQGHGLRRRADLRDWTVRMKQFFDHHLRGAPAPRWMTEGVPHHERERRARELVEPESLRLRREREAAAVSAGDG